MKSESESRSVVSDSCDPMDCFRQSVSSVVQSCLTLLTPWTEARQASLSITISQSLLKLISIESVMPSNHLILCRPPSPPAFNLSQHQGLFKWISSSLQVAKVLEFQPQHQSFQWTLRTPWNSPGQNTGVGSLSLLQGIFPAQESNQGLPYHRCILYQLSYDGSLEWPCEPIISLLDIIPKTTEIKYSSKRICTSVHSNTIHYSQKVEVEMVQILLIGWVNKWIVVYVCSGIFFSHNKEWSIGTCYIVNESWKLVNWKDPNTEYLSLYNIWHTKSGKPPSRWKANW